MWKPNKVLKFTPLFADKLELICHRDHELAQNTVAIAWTQLDNVTFLDTGITRTLRARHDAYWLETDRTHNSQRQHHH